MWAAVHVHLWCCLIPGPASLLPERRGRAGHTGVEVADCLSRSADPPVWLTRGLTPSEHAGRLGRERGLIRPSTRSRIEVPWVDPWWVVPLSAE